MRVSEQRSLAGSERGQPGCSCAGVFGGEAGLSRVACAGLALVGREGRAQPWCADPERGRRDLGERKAHLRSIVRAGSRIWSGAEDSFLK